MYSSVSCQTCKQDGYVVCYHNSDININHKYYKLILLLLYRILKKKKKKKQSEETIYLKKGLKSIFLNSDIILPQLYI